MPNLYDVHCMNCGIEFSSSPDHGVLRWVCPQCGYDHTIGLPGFNLGLGDWLRKMGDEMSDISQNCYCAVWMDGTEDVLRELTAIALETKAEAHLRGWTLYYSQAILLDAYHKILGGWATLNMEADEPPYVLLPDPPPLRLDWQPYQPETNPDSTNVAIDQGAVVLFVDKQEDGSWSWYAYNALPRAEIARADGFPGPELAQIAAEYWSVHEWPKLKPHWSFEAPTEIADRFPKIGLDNVGGSSANRITGEDADEHG